MMNHYRAVFKLRIGLAEQISKLMINLRIGYASIGHR